MTEKKFTINAKLLSGEIISIELNKNDTIETLYSIINETIEPMHIDLIKILFTDEEKEFTKETPVCEVFENGELVMIYIEQPKLKLYNKCDRVDFDDFEPKKKFTKYSFQILDQQNVLYELEFWYNNESNIFCEDSMYEETDKNRRTRRFETRIYFTGFYSNDLTSFLNQLVPEKYKQFMVDNFDYNELISGQAETIDLCY